MPGEQRFEINPYGVKYLCDCQSEMEFTGKSFMSNPPQYEHCCSSCGKIENLQEKYPTVKWEFVK